MDSRIPGKGTRDIRTVIGHLSEESNDHKSVDVEMNTFLTIPQKWGKVV